MDAFAVVVIVAVVALLAVVWLLGTRYPGSGLETLGLRSARELTERREALEAQDLEQMLAAHNARKRARGEAEVGAEELDARMLGETSEQRRRRPE